MSRQATSLFFQSGISFFIRVTSLGLSLVVSVVLSRVLGLESFGAYSLAFSLLTLFSIPAQAGLPALVVRETARYDAAEQLQVVVALWRWAGRFALVLSVGIALLACAAVLLFSWQSETAMSMLLGSVLIPLLALEKVRSAALRGLRKILLAQLPDGIVRPAILIVSILVWVWWSSAPLSAVDAMVLHALAAAVAFLLGSAWLRKSRPKVAAVSVGAAEKIVEWRRALVPLTLLSAVQIVAQQSDIVMLGWLGSIEGVAIYKVALSASSLMLLGLTAANIVVGPRFSRLYRQGNTVALQNLVRLTTLLGLIFTLAPFVILSVSGEWLLGVVYGSDYQASYLPLLILCCGQLLNALFGPVGLLLYMCGREQLALNASIAGTALNLMLNLLLIPDYGPVGAAVATAFSTAAWNGAYLLMVRRALGISTIGIPNIKNIGFND